ncbi:hypothetical protein LMG7053_06022 [Achromobacter ruhlandii]|uniref:Uncharacterized protein n=1 Tax=Achromobacter ruhlandii TaxID=72557 RepID=A0ABM8M4R2_9BURK|nr:hypothetical protein LMG7053_06022 [Achromobacter ruhlandii]
MRERAGQRRDAAQPRGAHQRRGVVADDAPAGIAVGRDRGAVAHFQHARLARHGAGQQQRQQRRVVGRIAHLEVIGQQLALVVQRGGHVHELARALGFPLVFLVAHQLHPHRRADGGRQQRGVGADVVGAVAAVAAGGLHADDLDAVLAQLEQAVQVGAQHVRVLGAGPDREAAVAMVGHRAGRPDGRVHLVGPDVGAAQAHGGGGTGGLDVAFLQQQPAAGGVGADGAGQVVQHGRGRHRFPAHLERAHGGFGLFLAIRHHADEIALHHHLDAARQVRDGIAVDVDQAAADEVAGVAAGVRRAHHAAVAHAGHAHVVHEAQFAGGLGRNVDARDGAADHGVVAGRLEPHLGIIGGQLQPGVLALHQLTVVQGAFVARIGGTHDAVAQAQRVRRHAPLSRGPRQQVLARLGGGAAQRGGRDLDAGAGDGGPLVGGGVGVAQHHFQSRHRHVQFLGHDLRQRGADAGAQVDVTVEGQRAPAARRGLIGQHRHEDFGRVLHVIRDHARLPGRRTRRRGRGAHDQQRAGVGQQRVVQRAGMGQVHGRRRSGRIG